MAKNQSIYHGFRQNVLVSPTAMRRIALLVALFISIFLIIAAYGKFFYPVKKIELLDRITSVFEVALIGFIFYFRMRAWSWSLCALLFGGWGGYAIYWCCLKLPCSCAGSMFTVPSGYALLLDILFFILSSGMAFLLGMTRTKIYLLILCALLCGLCGYVFAEWVFYEKIVGVIWRLF